MAHYAYLDENSIVTQVIVGKEEGEGGTDWEQYYGAVRTSYNTHGGQHPEGRPLRKNFAGIGYAYDAPRDAFIPPKPFASWVLNEDTCLWGAPTPMPQDGKPYRWDEATTSWIEVTTNV
jgi:hypothetical protein